MEEKIKVKDFIEKKLKDSDFRKIYEKNKESISSMEYAIHSNELEGNLHWKSYKRDNKKEIVFHNR